MSQNRDRDSRFQMPKIDQAPLNSSSQVATDDTASNYNFTASQTRSRRVLVDQSQGGSQAQGEDDGRSVISTLSYRSDLDASRLLRQIQGRVFNTLNETYFLPSDENEWTRLNKQHVAFMLALGGLYPAQGTVKAVLTPIAGERKKILDLGTGTGIWATEMAKKYQNTDVLGIDIAPVPAESDSVPANCRFEIDDIELGLAHFESQFDLIHARLITMGLKDFKKSLADVHNCLNPGGLVIWMEPDFDFFTHDVHKYAQMASEENPTGTWIGRIAYEMIRTGALVGRSDFSRMGEILDGGLWSDPWLDPQTCRTASLYVPIGTWANHEEPAISQRLKYIGALIRQDLHEATRGLRLIFTKAGWPAEPISQWQRSADEEMLDSKNQIQIRFRLAWGRRRAGPGQPAPPLPSTTSPAPAVSVSSSTPVNPSPLHSIEEQEEDPLFSSRTYPFYFVYETPEQALAAHRLRQRSKEGFLPPPQIPAPPTT